MRVWTVRVELGSWESVAAGSGGRGSGVRCVEWAGGEETWWLASEGPAPRGKWSTGGTDAGAKEKPTSVGKIPLSRWNLKGRVLFSV